MKILQIPNYFFPHIGGIEQVARDIASALKENPGIEQKIICFNEDAEAGGYCCKRGETVCEEIDGIAVTRCGCVTKAASQSLSPAYPAELKKLLDSFDPDIVIFHYPNPYVASFLLPMLRKKTKLILYWHLDITKQKHLGKLFHLQNLRLCRRADKIVATSPNYIEGSRYLSAFREKCVMFPLSISAERLAMTDAVREQTARIRRIYRGKTIVFAVGRHVEYKGMDYLVEAAKHLNEEFMILIGGKGPMTGELLREAKPLPNVRMLGRLDDETLLSCMMACDIFAFPSITKNEAFGIALAEALYCGKPAVTFNIPGSGVNYVSLDGVTGIECPNRDSRAFADALQKLADDPALRQQYAEAARQRADSLFLFDAYKTNIQKLIAEVYP